MLFRSAASWAYSILDGVANHQDRVAESDDEQPFRMSVMPMQRGEGLALALVGEYDF